MPTITCLGSNPVGNAIDASMLSALLGSTVSQSTSTQYVLTHFGGANDTVTFTGSGLQYTDSVPVGGTLTDVKFARQDGTTYQTWSGLSVSMAAFWSGMVAAQTTGDLTAVNALFFGGNDTFDMQGLTGSAYVYGYGGDDVFNYAGNLGGTSTINGGAGTNTLNLDGEYGESRGYSALGYVSNIQTVHLAAGHNYYLGVPSSGTMTFDAAALGAANSLTLYAVFATGTITANAGAGNDTVIAGRGNLIFNAGGGTDTIDYSSATSTVSVDLSQTGAQTVGSGLGSQTLNSVENVITSPYGGTYTGTSGDNQFIVTPGSAAKTINGGSGIDTVWFKTGNPITGDSGGITVDLRNTSTPAVTGVCGNVTLNSVEKIKGTTRGDIFIGTAADEDLDGGGMALAGYDTIDYEYATGAMTFTVSASDKTVLTATGGGQGSDTLRNMSRIIAAGYDDVFRVSNTTLTIDGGAGSDLIVLNGNRAEYRIDKAPTGTITLSGGYSGPATQLVLTNVERVQFADQTIALVLAGTPGDDVLTGTGDGDVFDISQGGNDTVNAVGYNCVVQVGAALNAADRINGGAVSRGSGATLIVGGGTNVTLDPTTVTNFQNIILQGPGDITLTVNDALVAPDTPAMINVTTAGAVVYDASAETDAWLTINGGAGPMRATGGARDDKIFGGKSDDVLAGGGGNDALNGGDGNDTLIGGAGNDELEGGNGSDTAKYSGARAAYTVTAAANGKYTVSGPDGTDTVNNIEFLLFDDQTVTPANAASGSGGGSITGTSGADNLTGTSGNDTINGGAGNDKISGLAGNDTLSGGDDEDTLTGGAGDDALDGGSSVDTAVVSGNRAAYVVTQTATGHFTVTGPDGTDTLINIEYLKFDDQTMRLLPGIGTTVNFAIDPSTYMAAIRDFDDIDLGGVASWKLVGTADVNGDGRAEHILFNRQIGRWAEVGTEADGLTYFANYNWAGDTRVVGIYIDPLVANGTVVKNSDTDSQRRFQNDLQIDNIKSILGQADYNHDGLQEVYFSLTDGTAYLHAYMHADGNIQYANYQSKQQVIDYLTSNGISSSTWSTWFPAAQVAMESVSLTGGFGAPSVLTVATGG